MKWKRVLKISLYAGFALAAMVVFLYARFPADVFKEIVVAKMTDRYPSCFVSLESIRPSFPPGLQLEKTVLWFDARPEASIQLDRVDIHPDLWQLLQGRTRLDFDVQAYGGMIKGQWGATGLLFSQGPPGGQIKFDNIPVQNVGYLKYIIGREVIGKLRGSLTYATTGKASSTGRLDFRMVNGSYPLADKSLGIDRLDFSELEGQAVLSQKTVKVEKLNLRSEQARCAVKGDIFLNMDDVRSSQLNLACNVEVRVPNNPQTFNKLAFTITGTFMNPLVVSKAF